MRLLLVRHGEAESNRDLTHGTVGSDRPLTREGIEQARVSAHFALGRWVVARIVCSPKQRAQQTAEIFADAYHVDVSIDKRLDEVNKGDWTGRPVPEITHIEDAIPFADRPTFRPPGLGAENWFDTGARVVSLAEELRYIEADDTLLVTHIEPIRAGVGMLLRTPADHWRDNDINNASFTQLESKDDRWSLDPSQYNITPYKDS